MIETTVQVTLPELGESVTEGSIVEWRKHVGDWIDAGETLVDVTTDKVDVEIPAPADGIVTALLAEEGATINVGSAIAAIDTSAVKPEGAPVNGAPANGKGAPAEPPTLVSPAGYGSAGTAAPPAERPDGKPGAAGGLATPQAKRVAERHAVDIAQSPRDRSRRLDPARRRRVGGRKGHCAADRAGAARAGAPARPGLGQDDRPEGAGRGARGLHGTEPNDPDCDEFPHLRGRDARNAPGFAQRRAQSRRPQREALVHPPDRMGDRPERRTTCRR